MTGPTDTPAQADLPVEVQEALHGLAFFSDDRSVNHRQIATVRDHIATLTRQLAEAQHELAAAAEDIGEYQRNLDAEVATRLSAERRLAEVEKDAARYRWLRHGDNDEPCLRDIYGRSLEQSDASFFLLRNEELDAAIDNAIAQGDKA